MHIARERQRDEKDAQRDRVEPPGRQFAGHQHVGRQYAGQQFAGRIGQEAAAADSRGNQVVLFAERPYDAAEFPDYAAGHALGQQPGREDQPQRRQGDPVARHVSGRAAHSHHPRTDSFEQRQADTDQDQQQQRVFDQREIEIMLENRVYVIREEDIDVQRNVFALEVDQRFDPAGQDQQKPSQRETGVHVTQQFVGAPYLAVQQRFADNLPDRAERRAGEQRTDE